MTNDDFVRIWNHSGTLGEAAEGLDMDPVNASAKATRLRRAGYGLKYMPATEANAMPTLEEIWGPGGLTEQIQAGWSDELRNKKLRPDVKPVPYRVQQTSVMTDGPFRHRY